MDIVIATRNAHKLEEIQTILNLPQIRWQTLDAWAEMPDVVEDGTTFEANAIKKARETAAYTGHWALADDSGLEVDALDGQPGVYSARYAGTHGDDDANNRKLLQEMRGVEQRSARFRCVLALSDPDGNTRTASGNVEGRIADACHGSHGFGYDVLFLPEGHEATFGVLDPGIKHAMSHRGEALRAMAPLLSATVR